MDRVDRDGDELMYHIMWRIMPLMVALMMLSVIDRSNVSYAKLQMVSGLGMSETAYGLASSLFFIGSLVFEVPSALAAHRFGARLWFARILLTWGLLTILLGFSFSGSFFAPITPYDVFVTKVNLKYLECPSIKAITVPTSWRTPMLLNRFAGFTELNTKLGLIFSVLGLKAASNRSTVELGLRRLETLGIFG